MSETTRHTCYLRQGEYVFHISYRVNIAEDSVSFDDVDVWREGELAMTISADLFRALFSVMDDFAQEILIVAMEQRVEQLEESENSNGKV